MIQQVIPVGKKLLIKQKKAEAFFKNTNIIIPEAAQKVENKGTVVAVGSGTKDNPITVSVGDQVLYGKYAGTELQHEGKEYLIMRESDLFAII